MLERIQETAAFLKAKMHSSPETAIILGTGLGSLVNEITEIGRASCRERVASPV